MTAPLANLSVDAHAEVAPGVGVRPDVPVVLADFVAAGVPLSWHEAAAVVLELLTVLPPRSAFPEIGRAFVLTTGEISTQGGTTVPGDPVAHTARLLNDLLPAAGAPPALRALADEHSSAAPASLEEFAKALAYFERPNRRGIVAAARSRVSIVVEKMHADRELERLRQKAAHSSAGSHERRPVLRPETKQIALVVGLSLLLAASVTVLAWTVMAGWPDVSPAEVRAQTAGAALTSAPSAAAVFNTLVEAGRRAIGAEPAATTGTAPASPAPARSAAGGVRRARPTTADASGERRSARAAAVSAAEESASSRAASGRDEWTVTVRELSPEEAEAAYRELQEPELSEHEGEPSVEVFSAADSEVYPPVLVRPQLPSLPEVEGASIFDLLISESGRVEQVRLVSPGNRFNDRMLMAAAKAWLFQPALRAGFPVKYRVRLPIVP